MMHTPLVMSQYHAAAAVAAAAAADLSGPGPGGEWDQPTRTLQDLHQEKPHVRQPLFLIFL